jgi:PhnB protein
MLNRSAPRAAVVPMVMYEDVAAAIAWLSRAFGLQESLRFADELGRVTHAQLLVADHEIMVGWPGEHYTSPGRHGHHCQSVLVHVEDVDAHHQRALAAGARMVSAPETQPFGERSYEAEDCEGHRWFFSQHVADVAPHDWGAIVAKDNSRWRL